MRLRTLSLLLAAALAASLAPAPAQSVAPPTSRDGHMDFSFLLGTWQTHYRILKKRLSNNHQWYSCSGTSVVRPFWNGYGNLEDGDLRCSGSHIVGMTLRLYNAQTHQWSLWWGTKTRGLVPPPQVGHFELGIGQFYAHAKHEGKPIIVRFKWTLLPGNHPYFEQAYSPDDGKTWETNWTCVYTRTLTAVAVFAATSAITLSEIQRSESPLSTFALRSKYRRAAAAQRRRPVVDRERQRELLVRESVESPYAR